MLRASRSPLGLAVVAVAAGCGTHSPTHSVPAPKNVVLVTPDTGPSALQRRLAAMPPAQPISPPAQQRRLEAALDRFHAEHPTRRGYIAVDKPLYRPGETIWFRAFDLPSAQLASADSGYGVHFQLISPKGAAVIEKNVMVQRGNAANDFVLPPSVPGGEYTIKARSDRGLALERAVIVSSYQPPRIKKKLEFLRKAYGPGDQVSAALALHRATGEALSRAEITGVVHLDGAELSRITAITDGDGNASVRFQLPPTIAEGDGLLTVLVADGGVTESIQKRIPITLDRLQLGLYPEGGDLVAGLPGRVYFQAKNPMDKPADIEGRVVDDRGKLAALFRSYHNGLGRFEMTPQPGRHYKVEITKPAGISQTFDVPAAATSGCTMQSIDDFRSRRPDLRAAVWCLRPQTITVTAMLRDKRLGTATARVAPGKPAVLALPAPASAQGAVRLTLFDDSLRPLAERLVYRNRGVDLDIQIQPDKKSYNPRDQVKLAIEARTAGGDPVAADLALAVVDDTVLSFADDKKAQLLAAVYLESEMPGQKVEEPNFYFSDDPKAPAALDMVMGAQGWRRFDWTQVIHDPEPIKAAWEFTGEFWKNPFGIARKPNVAKNDEAERGPVDAKAPPPPPRPGMARPEPEPEAPVAAKAKKAELARAPMAEPMAGEALDEEDLVLEDRNFRAQVRARGDFAAGGGRRARRIRDKDWGGPAADGRFVAWSPVRRFPVPSYAERYDGPRTDFRETIYWQPQVMTGADGKAEVSFYLSDAVTSFRAIAEGTGGGQPGRGEALIQSKLPVSLAVKMPLEVSAGDRIELPVTVSNETDETYTASLEANFGPAFKRVGQALPASLKLLPGQRRSFFYQLSVVGDGREADDGKALVAVTAGGLRDQVERTISVVPAGFPVEMSASGTASRGQRQHHSLAVTDVLPGSMKAKLTLYPSPLATMTEGLESVVREPTGCFEQASSANYPNVMVLAYMDDGEVADPALVERTQGMLDRGYQKLTGYESPHKGYEWFGGDPGHEALTAYGLMEFNDMRRVYDDIDEDMIRRTARWLKSRRDGKGGYQRNARALDSFGRASPEVTNAYVTYALTEAGEGGIDREIARQRQVASTTKDPYVLALATNTLLNADAGGKDAARAAKRLAAVQAEDGSFPGADHSITRSGGVALTIETTSLAALALMKAGDDYRSKVREAIDWINKNRSGFGGYGSTQSTVLALKALGAYATYSRRTSAAGTVRVWVNGKLAGETSYEKGHSGAIELDLAKAVGPGDNDIEIELDSDKPLPYSLLVQHRSKVPATSPGTAVGIATSLARRRVPLGEGVSMNVEVENRTGKGIPMTLARIGIPGGLTYQTWQLKELVDKKIIDFYETREREVILYFRSMAPRAKKSVKLELLAQVPGRYTAPASRAYLYYTDELKRWVDPVKVVVTR